MFGYVALLLPLTAALVQAIAERRLMQELDNLGLSLKSRAMTAAPPDTNPENASQKAVSES